MPALGNLEKHASLFIIILILTGCQAAYNSPQVKTAKGDPGFEIFNSALMATPEPDSIVRQGEKVTYMVVSDYAEGVKSLARFDADCTLPNAQMAWSSVGGMRLYTDDTGEAEHESSQLPEAQKHLYLQSAQLKQVCAQTSVPDWRLYSVPERQDWKMIDRASLKREGEKVTFWTAKVPTDEQLLPDANILYGQERQRWAANCSSQQITELSNFYLDTRGRVRYGTIQLQHKAVALNTLEDPERQLLKRICSEPQSLAEYKHFEGRQQPPFKLPEPVPAASVAKAIESLNMPTPEKNIKYIRLVYIDKNEEKVTGTQGMRRESRYTPTEAGKHLMERRGRGRHQSVNVSFRGLISLASKSITNDLNQPMVWNNTLADIQFEGNWASMPVGSTLKYTTAHPSDKKVIKKVEHTCEVQSQKAASTYHPSLVGNAKVISCVAYDSYNEKNTAAYAYLENYGLFIQVQIIEGIWNGEWVIAEVETN